MTKLKSISVAITLSCILIGVSSCDNDLVYEYEGDCAPKVQFIFKKHRQALNEIGGRETDAFYSTIESVHLFVFRSETGELVSDIYQTTENLLSAADIKVGQSTDKCYLPVDLAPGKYRFVAWCGLNEIDNNNAFYLNPGNSRTTYTDCKVKLSDATGMPVSDARYEAVYFGSLNEFEVLAGEDAPVIPIELTKDSNEISVWVQHATQTFADGDYYVVYTDANGAMSFDDNSITNPSRLEYHAYSTSLLNSNTEYNGSEMETGALVAHISTSRLMQANENDARLEVRARDGQTVFSIPFIKYVLNLQTFTRNAQYYLDCEDTYNCSFYLTGESGTWTPSRIIINNWVVVPDQNSDI